MDTPLDKPRSQFDEYITAVACVTTHAKVEIVRELFTASGAVGELHDDTVKQWLRRGKSRGFRDVFPNGVKKSGFDDYIKMWINDSWKQLQNEFHIATKNDRIDCSTESESEFLLSLFKQFIAILKVSMPEDMDEDTSSINKPTSEINAQEKQLYQYRISEEMFVQKMMNPSVASSMYDIFLNKHVNLGISEYIEGNPMNTFDIQVFIDSINENIFKQYHENFDDPMYKAIFEFSTELIKFHQLSALKSLKISTAEYESLVSQQRNVLNSIEMKIFELSGNLGTFIRDYDTDDPDDIVYSWSE